MHPRKIALVFGTRPDTIKLAPIILELQKCPRQFSVVTIATAQHRHMLDQVLKTFGIRVDHDLNIMQPKQSLASLTSRAVNALDAVLEKEKPDMVLVQGDTTTTFIGSLAAFYHRIPVGHVEAGLRTDDKLNPFPEEMNRRLTSAIAELHFAPTITAKNALLREGYARESIFVTGNSVIDALKIALQQDHRFSLRMLDRIVSQKKHIVLLTMHRRENWGKPMRGACCAVQRLAREFSGIDVVFPVHLNPEVREVVYPILDNLANVHLIEPLSYVDFAHLMAKSYFVITDSGGIQEEAPSLGKPVLVLRSVTERPEAVKFGTVKLVGLDQNRIYKTAKKLIESRPAYKKMASATNPYGDGKAAQRIVAILKHYFAFTKKLPSDFKIP
ncbi:MAG: UDP-N-acetylglucosamine 2-epimerase (non-hydrolyzing) [Ignavibacteriae bacterium]|nr:UDP-N-acetylglucosamine 2-epimerase (non-hydrolyzing) [Ignavibacteriota bacterium]